MSSQFWIAKSVNACNAHTRQVVDESNDNSSSLDFEKTFTSSTYRNLDRRLVRFGDVDIEQMTRAVSADLDLFCDTGKVRRSKFEAKSA
jgi:hypothetical protein